MKDLYYVLMYNHLGNVKQCKTLIKHGLIKVNGLVETDAKRKITEDDCIEYQNKIINSQPFTYISPKIIYVQIKMKKKNVSLI